ncbi:MAG: hypothetical protein IJD51_02365 [Clostridia bacterium]|nr:hypothetical protein [Clostridia bacterium]
MKKKNVFLFGSKLWCFLSEIPLALALYVTCYYNFTMNSPWRFIPMIIIISLIMVFIAVYFFRYITVSYEEIRYHGLFSSRDSAVINKDKTLILEMRPRASMRIYLWGNDGRPPLYEGLVGEGSIDIYLFRGRAIGGKGTLMRVLSYFDISRTDAERLLASEKAEEDYPTVFVTSEKNDDTRIVRIRFKETL